jgi:hypothetical protein
VTAASENPRSAAAAVEPQQAVAALSAAMTTAVTAPSVSPAPAPIVISQVAVVEIPDEDVSPPSWDQWVSLPMPAPEPPTGALVVRDDGGTVLGRPADGAEASLSRAALPASCGFAAHQEQERERAGAPLAHFAETQAEQEMCQELRDHGTSLNRALNEALRIHSGPAWRVEDHVWFEDRWMVASLCDE